MKIAADAPCSYAEIALHYLREQIINGELRAQEEAGGDRHRPDAGYQPRSRPGRSEAAGGGRAGWTTSPTGAVPWRCCHPGTPMRCSISGAIWKRWLWKSVTVPISDEGLFIMENALAEMRSFSDQDPMYPKVMADTPVPPADCTGQPDGPAGEDVGAADAPQRRHVPVHPQRQPLPPLPTASTTPPARNLVMAHEQILAAVQKRDLQEACRVLDSHYTKNGERVYRLSLMQEAAQDG